jgi:hypothetical protein
MLVRRQPWWHAVLVLFAEAVSIDGRLLFLFLVVVILFFAVAIAALAFGFVWAARAGRGSVQALTGWLVVGLLEFYVAAAVRNTPFGAVILLILVGQVLLFAISRRSGTKPGSND